MVIIQRHGRFRQTQFFFSVNHSIVTPDLSPHLLELEFLGPVTADDEVDGGVPRTYGRNHLDQKIDACFTRVRDDGQGREGILCDAVV